MARRIRISPKMPLAKKRERRRTLQRGGEQGPFFGFRKKRGAGGGAKVTVQRPSSNWERKKGKRVGGAFHKI